MTTIKGIYQNGEIILLEEVQHKRPQKILITFLDEEIQLEEDQIRTLSQAQPEAFLKEYLNDEREDLYQDYAKTNTQ